MVVYVLSALDRGIPPSEPIQPVVSNSIEILRDLPPEGLQWEEGKHSSVVHTEGGEPLFWADHGAKRYYIHECPVIKA